MLVGQVSRVQEFGPAGIEGQERGHPRAGLSADACRQDGLQHLAPGREVIIGDPAGEPQHGRREQAAAIDDFGQRLQWPRPAKPAFDPHAIALHLPIALAQRDQYASARLDLLAEGVGNEVVELLGRPRGEHDPGDELLRLVVGLPGLRLGIEEAALWGRHGGGKLGMHDEGRNPKFEYRNPKQIRNPNEGNSKHAVLGL